MSDDRERLAREMGRPADGTLARHPKDAFVFAEPYPMSPGLVRVFHGVIRALCPTDVAVPDLERRIEDQVRRMMRYMNPAVAAAFTVALRVLDWAPIWRFEKARLLHELTPEEASAIVERVAQSRIALLGDMVAGARAAVLAPYYDLEEVGEHIGWRPAPFIRERLQAVARIRAGAAPAGERIGPFSAASATIGRVAARFGVRAGAGERAAASVEGRS